MTPRNPAFIIKKIAVSISDSFCTCGRISGVRSDVDLPLVLHVPLMILLTQRLQYLLSPLICFVPGFLTNNCANRHMLRQLFGLSEEIAQQVAEEHRIRKLEFQMNFRLHDVHDLVHN